MPQNTNDLIPGGGPNQPGGLAQITSGGFYSVSTTGYAVQPAYSFSDDSLGFYQSGVSTIAVSYGTLNLATQAVRLSMRTLAASNITAAGGNTAVAVDEVGFVIGGASGATLFIKSGGTIYLFNSAASAIA